jgi:phosphatidylserine/phosphatidylglycerophosphate/cardiolipin synthase-like enzyme
MPSDISSFSAPGMNIYFQSARANIGSKPSEHLVSFINSAKKSLHCAIYDLRDPHVLDALKAASGRVNLQIAYDAGKNKTGPVETFADPKPSSDTAQAVIEQYGLEKCSTAVHVKGGHLMHSKYIIKDSIEVWTGSGNWTHGGLVLQDNNYLAIKSQELAAAYEKNFQNLVAADHVHPEKPKQADPAKLLSATRAIKVGAISVTPYFSGGGTEEIENAIVALLRKAHSVRVIAMLVSDDGILKALAPFKPASKNIKGVLDPHEMKQVMHPPHGKSREDPALFWFADGDSRFVAAPSHAYSNADKNDFMHNKVMILDDKTVITGSYNFSENAESNDENMLIIDSNEVAGAYTQYFDVLYSHYRNQGARLPPI